MPEARVRNKRDWSKTKKKINSQVVDCEVKFEEEKSFSPPTSLVLIMLSASLVENVAYTHTCRQLCVSTYLILMESLALEKVNGWLGKNYRSGVDKMGK